ncbi:hypothetical protein ACFZBE_03105 [Streptomyces sp. NPDC008061]|uniref:hypothetical protein n=1 Tax=Streptomyces sp. NPDC008061 TaxID=3364805 RepID=UPI0036E12D03
MTSLIEALVQQLDRDDDASFAARVQLVDIDRDATLTITEGLPTLGSFNQLTAIEVFEEVSDPHCGWTPAVNTAYPARAWTGNSIGLHPGNTWSKGPAPDPCWKPPNPSSAATSSSSPPGSTVPTYARSARPAAGVGGAPTGRTEVVRPA